MGRYDDTRDDRYHHQSTSRKQDDYFEEYDRERSYHQSRGRSKSRNRSESRNDMSSMERERGSNSRSSRGRSRSQSRVADNRSIGNTSRSKASGTSKTVSSAGGRSQLHIRSSSRNRRAKSRERGGKNNKSSRDPDIEQGVEFDCDDKEENQSSSKRGRSRSRLTNNRNRKKKDNHDGEDGPYDLEDSIYDEWSADDRSVNSDPGYHSRSNSKQRGGKKKKKKNKYYDEDDNHTQFTRVTIEPFLTDQPAGRPIGCCLMMDLKDILKWKPVFTFGQVLAGLSVALAQVPECISYAYIAGIDPFHALQATWIANLLTPIVGGRPGLACGPSALGAVAIRYIVATHGQEYIYYAVVLSGFCQVMFGGLRIGKYLRLLPPGITIGMVNALCIMLVALQMRYFKEFPSAQTIATNDADAIMLQNATAEVEPTRFLESNNVITVSEDTLNQPWAYFYGWNLPWSASTSHIIIVLLEALAAFLVCFILPRITAIVPASLVAVLLLTGVNIGLRDGTGWDAPTIGDYYDSDLSTNEFWQGIFHSSYTLPSSFHWKTITVVVPSGLSLFCVSLLETMVAINVTDRYSRTDAEQDRVFYGQGVANLAGGIMGGMCSSGQAHSSLHNLQMRGISSLSVFFAGVFMLMVTSIAYPVVAHIPLGAVMGITLFLTWSMFQWSPIVALLLKFVPGRCIENKPKLARKRHATPDLFSTFATSIFALCASTIALAGFVVGVLCYACDPISHAIFSDDNEHGYSFIELNLLRPSPRKKFGLIDRWRQRKAQRNDAESSKYSGSSARDFISDDRSECDESGK